MAEDTLGKLSIEPLTDTVDFKLWAKTVESIKLQTAHLDPAKRKIRHKTLIFESVSDRELKSKI